MYKSLGLGLCFLAVAVISAIFFHATRSLYLITGVIGVIAWFLAGGLTGSLGSGDKTRMLYDSDSPEDRDRRQRWSWSLFLVGLPNMIAAIILFLKSQGTF